MNREPRVRSSPQGTKESALTEAAIYRYRDIIRQDTAVVVVYYCRTYYKAVRVGGAAVAPRFPHTLSLFTMSGDEYFGHGP